MYVESCDASLPYEVLEQLWFRHSTISDIHKLHSYAVRRSNRKHSHLRSQLLALYHSVAVSGRLLAVTCFLKHNRLLLVKTSKRTTAFNHADPIETCLYIVGTYQTWVVSNDCNLLVFWHKKMTDFLLFTFLEGESGH